MTLFRLYHQLEQMKNGETFNINADTMAGTIASALKADRLLLLTDVSGVKDKSGE